MAIYIITRYPYDLRETLRIGELTGSLSQTLDDWGLIRMAWCIVESHGDLVLARLRWHEDY